MSDILHLGHQESDISGVTGLLVTTSGTFDSKYDINAIEIDVNKGGLSEFSLEWPIPSNNKISFQFRHKHFNENSVTNIQDTREWITFTDFFGETLCSVHQDSNTNSYFVKAFGDTEEKSIGDFRLGVRHINWFDIEVEVTASTIKIDIYLDSVLSASVSASNTTVSKSIPTKADISYLGQHNGFGNHQAYDAHFAVVDGTSTRGRRFVRNTPDTAATYTDFSGSVSVLGDGDVSTRISSDAANERQSFTLTGPSITTGTVVAAVHNRFIAQGGSAGPTGLASSLRIASTDYDNTAITPNISAPTVTIQSWDENPSDNSTWTESTVPSEFGFVTST